MHRSVHSFSLGTYFPININLRNAEMDFFFFFTGGIFLYIGNHLCGTDVASDKQVPQQNLLRQKQFYPVMCSPEAVLRGFM